MIVTCFDSNGYNLGVKTNAEEICFLISRGNSSSELNSRFEFARKLARRVVVLSMTPMIIAVISALRFFRKRTNSPRVIFHSLTIGQVMLGGTYEDFIEFIQAKRFKFDCKPNEALIELKGSRVPSKPKIPTTANIPLYLLIRCATWNEFLTFCRLLILTSWIILRNKNVQNKSFRSLVQIQIEYPLWQAVKLPDYFVTTQSCMQNLPVSFYMSRLKFQRLMMWYSTNNRPIPKVGEEFSPHANATELETFVDCHLIWNQAEAAWLRSNGITKLEVVGSIIFRPSYVGSSQNKIYDIVYFDVTAIPRNDIFMSEEMLIDNLSMFAEHVQQLRSETNSLISAYIKPKREDQKFHSESYLALRTRLVSTGVIQMLHYESDLYEVIAQSRVVLAVPFTSPANIALELGIPTAFFCFLVRDYQLGQQLGEIPILTHHLDFQGFLRNSICF